MCGSIRLSHSENHIWTSLGGGLALPMRSRRTGVVAAVPLWKWVHSRFERIEAIVPRPPLLEVIGDSYREGESNFDIPDGYSIVAALFTRQPAENTPIIPISMESMPVKTEMSCGILTVGPESFKRAYRIYTGGDIPDEIGKIVELTFRAHPGKNVRSPLILPKAKILVAV